MGTRGTSFAETMLGSVQLDGEAGPRAVRLDLAARSDDLVLPHRTTPARLTGRVRIEGLADDAGATGTLEISPLARRRIRYDLAFTADGSPHVLTGWKSVSLRRPLHSMTRLPYTLSRDGKEIGSGVLRFPTASGLLPFLTGWRFPRRDEDTDHLAPQWDGSPGRTEVWYATATDPADGAGIWVHEELVAPSDGSSAYTHGWFALFPPTGPVEHARFGPHPWTGEQGFSTAVGEGGPGLRRLRGNAGPYHWDLAEQPTGSPLYTLPEWAWRRKTLPAAHMLPSAASHYTGTVRGPGGTRQLRNAPGATARIYGHGSAQRWAWLHADLGDGSVLEIVAARSDRPVLRRLPPAVFLRLRHQGRDWPGSSWRPAFGVLGAGRFKASIGLPTWTVSGRIGNRRIRVTVHQPAERTLVLEYTNPDGSRAVCRNSETADAEITVDRWVGHWYRELHWKPAGTAHAEVGSR